MRRFGLDVLLLDESEAPSSQVAEGRTFLFTRDSGNERHWECVCLQNVRCDKGSGVSAFVLEHYILFFKVFGDFLFVLHYFAQRSVQNS